MRGVDRLRLVVAGGISVLWVAATIYDALSPTYEVPTNLQNLMMLVAGFLFTPTVIRAAARRTKNGDDDAA